ncbi:hypothetical protein B0G76_2293 [Paraburkholderia sp. BL23I1N1]|uniref:hypothetical protein n=1 Tax=Paraburkholderia sp. BL23I1N1 TaxID=1938802 RepID=UPI000E771BED|nr:hypothetical protein [Paraburkholderia sp. BL23I1N1]RKE36136.1 hypothetical protein B0G76_2293 [Paraburkholderia sp. BL23I1N1]
MNTIILRVLIVLAEIGVTVAAALGLLHAFLALPMNMPYEVDMFLRAILHASGNDELANPDDMEILALFLYLFVCLVIAGCAVLACNVALRRYLAKRAKMHSAGKKIKQNPSP